MGSLPGTKKKRGECIGGERDQSGQANGLAAALPNQIQNWIRVCPTCGIRFRLQTETIPDISDWAKCRSLSVRIFDRAGEHKADRARSLPVRRTRCSVRSRKERTPN